MFKHFIPSVFLAIMFSILSCSSQAAGKGEVAEAPQQKDSTLSPKSEFNTDSAMYFLKKQVDFGPRVPGSTAHKACADWLSSTLKGMGATVTDKNESTRHPVSGENIPVRNIFAQFNPEAKERLLVLAHYDTRPWADEDPNSSNHDKPIDGANDGASGVAVALELARHHNLLDPSKGLDILFVDQEDSGSSGDDISWCIGSRLWASNMPYPSGIRPEFAILLDMVGGRDAVFMREYFSDMYATEVNNRIWNAAAAAGHASRFVNRPGGAINDDHIPLLQAGLPTVDIIEMTQDGFNPTWHTLNDNFENIDPATIGVVGEVMTRVIYN